MIQEIEIKKKTDYVLNYALLKYQQKKITEETK
jgi:hypothetical protein